MQYLYLIKCQQYYKIGVASDVESRLAQLSTGNPFPLEVKIVYEFDNAEIVERAIHQKLKNKRVRGEWFELSYEDTTELHKLCLMLGGSAFEYKGENPDEEAIEEAEEIQESMEDFEYSTETMRTELRLFDGQLRGVAIVLRGKQRGAIAYFGKRHAEFRKYLEIYRNEHPESKVLSHDDLAVEAGAIPQEAEVK